MPGAETLSIRVFDPATRALHWLTAALMLAAFLLAFAIDQATSKAAHTAILNLHRSVGLTILGLTMARLVWRRFGTHPAFPDDMAALMRMAARASEQALYMLLLLQPLLGLLQTNARGDRVDFFLLGRLPALIAPDRAVSRQLLEAHRLTGFLLLALIALHGAAALFHHFWRRDDTLAAMLPVIAGPRRALSEGPSGEPRPQGVRTGSRTARSAGAG